MCFNSTRKGRRRNTMLMLPPTQTSLSLSLSRWKCARKGRREGDYGQDVASPPVCTLPMVPCGSSPITLLYDEKNEAPEGEADVDVLPLNRYFIYLFIYLYSKATQALRAVKPFQAPVQSFSFFLFPNLPFLGCSGNAREKIQTLLSRI